MHVSDQTRRRLCQARQLLREIPERQLSIEAVARRVAISPSHFTKQFEALFGLTPHQLRIEARLERARRLLARGAAVTDVCMAVGWSSLGSFSDLFSAASASRRPSFVAEHASGLLHPTGRCRRCLAAWA